MTHHVVDLLRDSSGIYGIGLTDCGADESADDLPFFSSLADRLPPIIVRPDRLTGNYAGYYKPVLQPVFGGFRHGVFSKSCEEMLRQEIHHAMLNRAGLHWPPHVRYWSDDPEQQKRNRGKYHGLRPASLNIVNNLIRQLLNEADQEALKAARRFPHEFRHDLYVAGARHRNSLQLLTTFPALAAHIFCARGYDDAKAMVIDGAPLREIAAVARVPYALRKVKPGAVRAAASARFRYAG